MQAALQEVGDFQVIFNKCVFADFKGVQVYTLQNYFWEDSFPKMPLHCIETKHPIQEIKL